MIEEIQVRGRVKLLEGPNEIIDDIMLANFREEINLLGLPAPLAINGFKEVDSDFDDNDGKTTEVSITYGK